MRLRAPALAASAAVLATCLLAGCGSDNPPTVNAKPTGADARPAPTQSSAAATPSPAGSPSAPASSGPATAPPTMSAQEQQQALARAYAQYVEPKPPGNTPAVTGKPGAKPLIAKPVGAEPKKMVVKDLTVGTGKAAPINATVTIDYLGVTWADGKPFDTSFGKAPATFGLGNLIGGWQVGIPGMKEGGRRELVIPAGDLAYGPAPAAGATGAHPLAGKTLVFVIDLKKVA